MLEREVTHVELPVLGVPEAKKFIASARVNGRNAGSRKNYGNQRRLDRRMTTRTLSLARIRFRGTASFSWIAGKPAHAMDIAVRFPVVTDKRGEHGIYYRRYARHAVRKATSQAALFQQRGARELMRDRKRRVLRASYRSIALLLFISTTPIERCARVKTSIESPPPGDSRSCHIQLYRSHGEY